MEIRYKNKLLSSKYYFTYQNYFLIEELFHVRKVFHDRKIFGVKKCFMLKIGSIFQNYFVFDKQYCFRKTISCLENNYVSEKLFRFGKLFHVRKDISDPIIISYLKKYFVSVKFSQYSLLAKSIFDPSKCNVNEKTHCQVSSCYKVDLR